MIPTIHKVTWEDTDAALVRIEGAGLVDDANLLRALLDVLRGLLSGTAPEGDAALYIGREEDT